MIENGRLRRRELRVLPKFAAFEALAPDAFVFGRHRGGENSSNILRIKNLEMSISTEKERK